MQADRRPARVALLLQLAFLASAFGWRTFRQWRETGDTGFRISRRSPVKDRVASLLMVGGGALGVLGTARAPRRPRSGGVPVLGTALMVGGVVATLRAQVDMGRSWRIGVDAAETTDLVTEGLFQWSRNPIFTGMAAVACGTVLAVPGVATAAGAALLLAGVEAQVRLVEEPYLLRTHGEGYRDYATRTGRFLPGLGRLST